MSMLQDFFSFLTELFQEGEEMDHETVKERLAEEGYEDVTAYDVKEAVSLMYEEGSVFNSQQSSYLDAYTGGNAVDQSFNAGDIGVVNAPSVAQTGGSSGGGSSSGGGYPAPPPPPPMDPGEGYTPLDAAVEQIIYVNNITNNTTVNDQDVFEDNDIVTDASVNQTLLAAGDVHQDFDTTVVGEEGIAVDGPVEDSNLVTGDNEGYIMDDVEDSAFVGGDNSGVNAVGSNVEGNALGDHNTVLSDADGNAVGDNAAALNVGGNTNAPTALGGDAIYADSSAVETGDGDQAAIADSAVGSAGFGSGDATNTTISDNYIDDSAVQTGDYNEADVAPTETLDASIDVVAIDDSALIGSGVSADGDATGEVDLDLDLTEIEVTAEAEPEPEPEPAGS